MDQNLRNRPFVTILMPVFNAEKYLDQALVSILQQTYSHFELLVINDGSTDESEDIILKHQSSDTRVRYVKNECNLQLIATLNKGFQLAKGDYIARMDADDLALPHRLERQVEIMEKNKEIGICGSWIQVFGVRNELIQYPETHEEIAAALFFYNPFSHPSVMFRRKEIDRLKMFYHSDYLHAEDYKLWFQHFQYTTFYNIPEVLLHYRVHEDQFGFIAPHASIESTKRLKSEALKLFGTDFTEEEQEEWLRIVNGSPTLDYLTINTIYKVLKQNRLKKIVSPMVFERKLAAVWKNSFLEARHLSLAQLFLVFKDPIRIHLHLTFPQKLSFLKKFFVYNLHSLIF